MAVNTRRLVVTSSVVVVVVVALFVSFGSSTPAQECVLTFTNCSSSTLTSPAGCCGRNESGRTICRRQGSGMHNFSWQEWNCSSEVMMSAAVNWASQCQACGNCTSNSSAEEQRQLCCPRGSWSDWSYSAINSDTSRKRGRYWQPEGNCGGCCPGNESEIIPFTGSLAPTTVIVTTNKISILTTNGVTTSAYQYLYIALTPIVSIRPTIMNTSGMLIDPKDATMKSIMSSTTPVSTSPPPEDDGFWSEFKIGIVLAIIIIPLLIFLPIIVGVIFIAVRIHYRKMAVYRMSNRSTLSPGRVHSNMPSHLKRTSIVGSGDVIIDNPTIKWLTFPTPVPPANPPSERVPVPRQPTELDNPASPVREFYSYPRPRCRRISENVLYEPSDDIYTTLPEHGQQSELEPSFSPSIPLYQLSPSIDQRPQHPLPSSAMPIPQPQLTTSSGTQPQDPSSTGLLVMSVSPRVGSNGISNLREVRHEDRQRNPSSSRRFSDIDPGYETLTKFTGGPSLSMSPPTPMTEVSELPAKSQAEPLIRQTHYYDDEQQRPSVDQVTPRLMPQPHINEPLTVSTLPSDASLPHKYTKMALDSRQGSRENIQIRYDKGQITAVSNPMYSYPLHQSRSLTDLTHHRLEESLVQQLQAMKASIESNPKITGEEALPDSRITPGARITPEQSTAASSVIGPKSGINPRASTMPATPSVGIRSGINPEESTMPVQSATTSSVDIRSGINPEESTMPVQSAMTPSVDIRSGINPEESTMPVQSATTSSVDIRSGINPEESTMPVQSTTTPSVGIKSDVVSGGGAIYTYCIDV